ncbi:MAG: lasso peptide biosynthesis protein [Deltaproteobacteria bacterium]|nr:lasso peptide biosynthesis protein [Deltaproteobacteria bacterium]
MKKCKTLVRGKVLHKIFIFFGTFWYGWNFVNRIKRSKAMLTDYLDDVLKTKKHRAGLGAEEICQTIMRASSNFWFHKQQICLARSVVAYYYLTIYGYEPCLMMEVDFTANNYYNCHSWVCLKEDLTEEHMDTLNIIDKKNKFIMIEKNRDRKGDDDAKHTTNQLLQSELPLLFCWQDDVPKGQ